MFEITIGRSEKNQGSRILVNLDRTYLAIPKVVLAGAGNTRGRLKKFYQSCLGSGSEGKQQQAIFQQFAFIYGHGKKDGKGLHLVCNCRHHAFHAQVVKEFLEENSEMLNMVSGYVVPGSGPVAQTTEDRTQNAPEGDPGAPPMNFGNSSVQLPPDEMAQIQRLIEEDQARERLAAAPQGQTVPDESQQITE